jgi:hypothetical protein
MASHRPPTGRQARAKNRALGRELFREAFELAKKKVA